MSFCSNCGSQVDGQFCQKCGTPIGAAPPRAAAPPPPPPPSYQQPAPPPTGQHYQPSAAPPPPGAYYQQPGQPPPYYQQPGQPPAATGEGLTENAAAALCYLAGLITGILFLVLEPYNKNRTIRFHAFQSIFLNVAWIAVYIVLSILFRIMLQILPYSLWSLIGLLYWVVLLPFVILWVMLMVKAYQNQKWVLPIIGPIAEKQA